jgi:hypothetical protein
MSLVRPAHKKRWRFLRIWSEPGPGKICKGEPTDERVGRNRFIAPLRRQSTMRVPV